MAKRSKRRQPKKGGGSKASSSSNNIAAAAADDAFLEQAIKQAASEKAALDQQIINEAAATTKEEDDEGGGDNNITPSDALDSTAFAKEYMEEFHKDEKLDKIRAAINDYYEAQQSSSCRSGAAAWSHLPPDQAALMTQWEQSMPSSHLQPNTSAAQTLKNMRITPAFVKDIPIGNWLALIHRMQSVEKRVYIKNVPPLHSGDYVEIVAGNHIKWELVGEKGCIVDYFDDEDKWGLEMDKKEEIGPSLVFAGNLKRLSRFDDFDY